MTRVTWITNLAAPYRVPVWKSLGQEYPLSVRTIVSERNFQRDAKNRGSDWAGHALNEYYKQSSLRSYRFPVISRPLNLILSPSEMRGLASSDVFVLSGWHDLIYWQLLLLAKCAGIATVGFYESTLETQTRKSGFAAFFRSLFFRSLDAVVTPGIAATEALSAMGLESRKIVQGFNAIDVELFSKTDSDSRYTQNPGHNFIFVGRLIALKNVGNIIRAFESVADSEDRLTIVGDGECKNSLRNLTAELGLQDRVNFLGSLNNDELPAVLARQSTLILVSSTEVWGLVVNEALASGLHVVVGRNCGVSRSVAHMRGVFITEIDIDSISTAMARSRSEWMGRISDPEILRFSPIEFAECFKLAIQKSIDGRSSVI